MFDFSCDECGRGKVRAHVLEDFRTKVRGNPFTVPKAVVGICDNCGAEYFEPSEIKRWRELYDTYLEESGIQLLTADISATRQALNLSVGDFSAIIGSTRQSVYNWERADRRVPQNRTVDLLIRLVRESAAAGPVDVIAFLVDQARTLGREIRVGTPSVSHRCRGVYGRHRFAPREQFDCLYNERGEPRPVPALVSI